MSTAHELDTAQSFIELGRDIAGQDDPDSARIRIVELAVASMGLGGAGIWCPDSKGHLHLDACTDPQLHHLFDAICQSAHGLGEACFNGRVDLHVDDFATDARWPEYAHRLVYDTPVRSAAAFYLGMEDRALGVLIFYATTPDAYRDEQLRLGQVFASLSALALDGALHAGTASNLRLALNSNRRIGIAIGVLMVRYNLDEDGAFEKMRWASTQAHRKLRDIAEAVLMTGVLGDL